MAYGGSYGVDYDPEVFRNQLAKVRDKLAANEYDTFDMRWPWSCIGGKVQKDNGIAFACHNHPAFGLFFGKGSRDDADGDGRYWGRATQAEAAQACTNYLNGNTESPWAGIY